MLQPSRMKSEASQSSSSGWLGGLPCVPKSSDVRTSPCPNNSCQKRLTATRAVKGFCIRNQPACQVQARWLALGQRAQERRRARALPRRPDSYSCRADEYKRCAAWDDSEMVGAWVSCG